MACTYGRADINLREVVHSLLHGFGVVSYTDLDPTFKVIIFNIRLSRVVLSALVGVALAVSGTAFQGLLRNPLADPFTIGVSTGAAFGASLALGFGLGSLGRLGLLALPLASLAGALIALFAVIALSRDEGQVRRGTMILGGIVVATFMSSLISLVKSLNEESVASIVFWVMGSFQGRGWPHVGFILPYMIIGLLLIARYSRELDILALGENQARQLGINVDSVRLRILIGASLLTAGAVSVSGVIGFVGLVVPHVVRMSFGGEHRPLLVLCGILGGVVLLWADVLARIILPGGEEMPVGVITALLGGPFFCFLLKRQKSKVII